MRIDKRKAVFGLVIAGVAAALLLPPAMYVIGLLLGPPPPVAAGTYVTPLLAQAIWARADGQDATQLTPVTPITAGRFAACMAMADFADRSPGDDLRAQRCRGLLPAIQAVEYLSGVHIRDANYQPSIKTGISQFSNAIWMTHFWTKTDLISTLAERGEFGPGFRGVEAAARGYFARASKELSLPQAAMIGALIGVRGIDPWCDPAGAAALRHRILERMRNNHAITDDAYQAADVSALGLVQPPSDHPPCGSTRGGS